MRETLRYLLDYLLGCSGFADLIGYTREMAQWSRYKLVIVPSGLFEAEVFGQAASLPDLPLPSFRGVPVFFGTPKVGKKAQVQVLYADVVASAFFLLSRYEERVNPRRDEHGRFRAAYSLLGQSGWLQIPVVQRYGALLRTLLRESGVSVPEPKPVFQAVMTHDLDKIEQYHNLRGWIGGCLKGRAGQAIAALGGWHRDILYTFPWMHALEARHPAVQVKVFARAGCSPLPQDRPQYRLRSRAMQTLLKEYAPVGLHASYAAGLSPARLHAEKTALEQACGYSITANRHHFLASREPLDMQALIDGGFTDDYTLGFADAAGFRLGTCRPVRWIRPDNLHLTSLTLHPLMVMDVSLSDTRYMHLSEEEAFRCCAHSIALTREYGGEWVGLWHNSTVSELDRSYHRRLYRRVLDLL